MFNRPPLTLTPSGERMTDDQLKQSALQTFPGYTVSHVWPQKDPTRAVEIWLERTAFPDRFTASSILIPENTSGIRTRRWCVSSSGSRLCTMIF